MPAQHEIDDTTRVITTTWHGRAVDTELIEALSRYYEGIKGRPEYLGYDEVLDFSESTGFDLTTAGLCRLVDIAVKRDLPTVKTRLAIVVTSTIAYGLARMYQTYRGLEPNASKEVRVFREQGAALKWITSRGEGE